MPSTHDYADVREALRTPRAAAIAGIVFAVLFATAFVLVRSSAPSDPSQVGEWITSDARRRNVALAMYLLPFAAIAFLWFIAAVRSRLGDREDRFFATVFLGSGLLFIAMLFVGGANAAGLLAVKSGAEGIDTVVVFGHDTFRSALGIYALRMAAVFTIATTTLAGRLGVVPRWLVVSGYATGLVLLVAVNLVSWLELLFPLWVLVLSIHILVSTLRDH